MRFNITRLNGYTLAVLLMYQQGTGIIFINLEVESTI